MNDADLLEPPDIGAARSGKSKWHVEREAFLRLVPSLLEASRGQYVAVHGGRVVASGPDQVALAMEAYRRYGYVPIYVGLVSEETATARIPSPRRHSPPAA
jgi:hypothetical protein